MTEYREDDPQPRGWPSRVLMAVVAGAAVVVFVVSAMAGRDDEDPSAADDEIVLPSVDDTAPLDTGVALPSVAWADDNGVVAHFDGTNPTRIEREPTCCVAWSADGEYLAYRQTDTIVVRHREQATPVITAPNARMTWSPVAPVLAVAWYDDTGAHIDVVDARTGVASRVADGSTDVLWSPDGAQLAVGVPQPSPAGPQESLGIVDLVDGQPTGVPRVVLGAPYANVDYSLYFASWSPDGAHVLAWIDEYHSGSGAMDGLDVVAIDVATGAAQPVGHSLLVRSWFQWSPDGTTFLMVESAGRMVTDPRSVMRCTLAGGCAAVSVYGQTTDPSWSPDGTRYAYVLNDATSDLNQFVVDAEPQWDVRYDMRRLWIADADDGHAHQVTDAGHAIAMPRWLDGDTLVYMRGVRMWRMELDGIPAPVSATIRLDESPIDAVYDPTDVTPPPAWDQRIAIAR